MSPLAASAAGPEGSFGLSFTLSNSGTKGASKETVTRKVDGLTISYPADEADVVELLLPAITQYRAARAKDAKSEAKDFLEALSDDVHREKLRRQVARVLELEEIPGKSFDDAHKAALEGAETFVRNWEKWSGDLSALSFWNHATGESFKAGERVVFPEINYQTDAASGKVQLAVKPPFIGANIGMDFFRPATHPRGAAATAFRLDIPLFYRPGVSAAKLASERKGVFELLPRIFRELLTKAAMFGGDALTEALLRSEIATNFFHDEVAKDPRGAAMIRGLARSYLVIFLKPRLEGSTESESEMLSKLGHIDVPKDEAERAKFVQALEADDPNALRAERNDGLSEDVARAYGRMYALTFIQLAQVGEDPGMPILKKLQKKRLMPKGGFAGVSELTAALEKAYPAGFQKTFAGFRSDALDSIRKAHPAKPAGPSPSEETKVEQAPLPNRESKDFDGINISYPSSLGPAMAKLGPELAQLLKQARKHLAERFSATVVPPVPISDDTLEMLREAGLEVTRDQANTLTLQVAWLSNSRRLLARMFEGDGLQIWFKSDLAEQLKAGRSIPGFSYNAESGTVTFDFAVKMKGQIDIEKPVTLESLNELIGVQPATVFPIVLKDNTIASIADPDAQAAAIRKDDTKITRMFEAAETLTPGQLGIPEDEVARGGGILNPHQSLFLAVHELAESSVIDKIVASPDRRWFCDGIANLLAIRACDEQFGDSGKNVGMKVFESLYDPALYAERARDVDLLAWQAVEAGEDSKQDKVVLTAHYYFATRVLIAATEGRREDFLKSWITKIRETPWNRANSDTIIAAYDKLTGASLRDIMKRIVSKPRTQK